MFPQPLAQIIPEALFLLGEFKIHAGLPARHSTVCDGACAVLWLYSISETVSPAFAAVQMPSCTREQSRLLAWLHDDVDQGQPPFVLDDAEGALQGRADGVRGFDGA